MPSQKPNKSLFLAVAMFENYNKQKPLSYYLLALTMLGAMIYVAYLIPTSAAIFSFWAAMAVAFGAYLYIIKQYNAAIFFKSSLALAILLRCTFLFAVPLLSDDYYRFIWDGAQILHGINPFAFTPNELAKLNYSWLDLNLLQHMNSPDYFSVYPPVNQLAFALMAIPGKQQILSSTTILHTIIILFDVGNIFLIISILKHFNKAKSLALLYALNPLAIVELSGNLHFEAVMIFFSLLALYLLNKKRWILASLALALGICAKLLPVILLPLFLKKVGFKKTIFAGFIVAFTCILLFLPFIHSVQLAKNMFSSIQLYYGNFEFNGSIYLVLKQLGWMLLGQNPNAVLSPLLLALTLFGFALAYFKAANVFETAFWFFFVYYLFSAVVHPWYIIILLALSPFIRWRFALIWSALIVLSYYAYATLPYQQNYLLNAIAYIALAIFIFTERRRFSLKNKIA